jgi:predicted Zn-dependent protease
VTTRVLILCACVTALLGAALAALGCKQVRKTAGAAAQVVLENPDLIKDEKDRAKWQAGARAVKSFTTEIGTAEEIAMGQSLAVRSFASFGRPHPDEALQRYVAMVGKVVALQSERPSLPYSFAVVQNDEANALSLPGGYVFISTGLLRQLHDESELACVLGHEVCHVAQKHGIQIVGRDRRVVSLVELGSLLEKDVARYRELIDRVYERLTVEGYDQDFEWQADEGGAAYAFRAGYYPGGLLPFLEHSRNTGEQMERYKTHPDPAVRIRKLSKTLVSLDGYAGMPKLDERYRMEVLAKLP